MAEELTTPPTNAPPSGASPATPRPSPSPPSPPAPALDVDALTSDAVAAQAPPSELPLEAEPAPLTYKYRGQEYTREQLEQILPAVLTTAEQLPHLQDKYQGVLEEQLRQREQPPALAQPEVRMRYAGELNRAVKDGYLESDLAELYPDFASQAMLHRDLLYDTRRALIALQQEVGGYTGRQRAEEGRAKLDTALDGLATHGLNGLGTEIFAALKEPTEREGFFGFLLQSNPTVDKLTPEFLGRQYLAYKGDVLLTAANAAAMVARDQRGQAIRQAQGVGRSARPVTPQAPTKSHLDALTEDMLFPRRP